MTNEDEQYTRRQYLIMRALLKGVNWMAAEEAVSATALANPEWDMEERKTYSEWQRARGTGI